MGGQRSGTAALVAVWMCGCVYMAIQLSFRSHVRVLVTSVSMRAAEPGPARPGGVGCLISMGPKGLMHAHADGGCPRSKSATGPLDFPGLPRPNAPLTIERHHFPLSTGQLPTRGKAGLQRRFPTFYYVKRNKPKGDGQLTRRACVRAGQGA